MDHPAGILLAANLVAVTDKFYRSVGNIERAAHDPKEHGFYVRLLTEKARYADWKRRMGIETSHDAKTLISKLPEDAQRSFPLILAPMQKYVKESEQLFVKYGIAPPDAADTHRNFKAKLRRIGFLMNGHRQLNDLLDTLKNCNDGLLTIAPPPSGHHVILAGNDPTVVDPEAQYTGLDAAQRPQRPQPPQSTSNPEISVPSSDRRAEPTPQMSRTSTTNTPAQESSEKAFHPVIELLHSTCLRVLRSIVMQYPNFKETFQSIGDRLAIWGTGLFQGQVSIDQALNRSSRAIDLLRNNIAGILADIAVILRRRSPVGFNLWGFDSFGVFFFDANSRERFLDETG